MRVLIENAVPLNNGDAALIFALGNKLKAKGYTVEYSTFNIESVQKKYPNEIWVSSLLNRKIVRAPFTGFIILVAVLLFSSNYKKYDAVISAPGGYVNSYYGFKRKLQLLCLYKKISGIKVYMYSQSIGPLNEKDKTILRKYFDCFDMFYVRDNISMERMRIMNLQGNVYLTKDAAFLLEPISGIKTEKTVAISVREWKHDERNEAKYIQLISKMIKNLVEKNYSVKFLSTCQGDSNYTDDSIMAKKIVMSIPRELRENIEIDSNYYSLEELRLKLTEYEFVIGTRLHMCILSWLSGTPAFNISYEEKGKESYDYLGAPEYSVDYNFSRDIGPILDNFINESYNKGIFNRIDKIRIESNLYFDKLVQNIEQK